MLPGVTEKDKRKLYFENNEGFYEFLKESTTIPK